MKHINNYLAESILRSAGLSKDDLIIERFKEWIEENASKSRIKSIDIKNKKVFIKGDIIINSNVTSINPSIEIEEVEGDFDCIGCEELESLEGAPNIIKNGDFNCLFCNKITSLEGAPEIVRGNFDCKGCINLTSLEGAPKEVGGNFNCSHCKRLETLEGAPEIVRGNFNCSSCEDLKSLGNTPKEVGKKFLYTSQYINKNDIEDIFNVKGRILNQYN